MYMYMNFTAQNIDAKYVLHVQANVARVHVHHQNDQDQGKFHIARLHCIFALRCVLCCPGTSESVSLRLAPECSALPSLDLMQSKEEDMTYR